MSIRSIFLVLLSHLILSMPAAAETVAGAVSHFDPVRRTIVLDNGQSYHLPDTIDIDVLKTGASLVILFDNEEGINVITAMQDGS